MITVDVITKQFEVEVEAKNIVSAAADAIAVIKDTDGNILKTENIPSGFTEDITINNGNINRSDATLITTILAEGTATISDSVVTLKNTLTTTLSTTNVLADKATTITAPDATANAKNSLNNTIGTANVPSGATGNVTVGDSSILRSDLTTIATTPATVSYTVADSPVRVEYVNGTLISNTNVKAASSATIQVPNPTVCPTLDELVNTSTTAQVVTAIELANKECAVTAAFLAYYGSSPYVLGGFATVSSLALSIYINGNTIYVLNNNQVDLYSATTFAFIGSVLGFNRASEIAFTATTYAVVNFGNNTVSVRNISDNVEIANFSVVSGAFSIIYSADSTLIYVAALSAAGSLSIYNTSGVLQGTVTGFDANIIEMRTVGSEYWVLTATGTSAGSTQRVRKMRFSDNTQVSTHSIGTVATIGAIRSMTIISANVYILTSVSSQIGYNIIRYALDFTGATTYLLGLGGQGAYGIAYNENKCNTLIFINPSVGNCINILL